MRNTVQAEIRARALAEGNAHRRAFLTLFDLKFPVFSPSWPDQMRKNWLEMFGDLLRIYRETFNEEAALTGQLEEVQRLRGSRELPVDLADDICQEVAASLLEDGPSDNLTVLVRQVTKRLRKEGDLKYRVVSLDAPIGCGPETYADRLEG